MAILKRVSVLILMVITITEAGWGQQFDKQLAAFSQSYTLESDGNLLAAVNALKEVYDDSSYELNLRLGWLCYKSGEFQQSEAYYRKAVALRPYGIEARFGLILPVSSLGNWTQVMRIYDELLAIDPNNTMANYRYGLLMYNREDYLKAEKLLTKVVNLYPFDYDSVVLLAWIKYKLTKTLEAKVLFQKALLYKPSDPSATQGLNLIK